jgi:hypothetical protein
LVRYAPASGLHIGFRGSPHHQPCSLSGGSPFLTAICGQTLAISVRTSNTTRSMLRRIARSPRGAHRAGRLDSAVNVTPAMRRSAHRLLPGHQLAPPLHQAQLQHLSLDLDVISVGLRARRLPPLTPQISQIGNAALVEREAVTVPLDHAFSFELVDVGAAAI